jgi:hypothetical protein
MRNKQVPRKILTFIRLNIMVLLVNSGSKGADKHLPKNQVKTDLRKIRMTGKICPGSAKKALFPENSENNKRFEIVWDQGATKLSQ